MNKKKLNNKGFTLIELLAVITIMGILMMVAIPAVTRTIENSRRDSFNTIAKSYMDAVRNAWVSDNIVCYYEGEWTVSSGVSGSSSGQEYYFPICTSDKAATENTSGCVDYAQMSRGEIESSTKDLMESGGKSSFGNADIFGVIKVTKTDTDETTDTSGNKTEAKSSIKYEILIGDTGKHGYGSYKTGKELTRSNVMTSGAKVTSAHDGASKDTESDTTIMPCKLS